MDDFHRFSAIAYRLGTKKGYMYNKPSLDLSSKQYYVLYGNLFYCYRCEDASTFISVNFLESSTIKSINSTISSSDNKNIYGVSITTVGGMMLTLYGSSAPDIQEWIDAIETNKFISIIRKFEDIEASSIQYKYRIELQDNRILELESICDDIMSQKHEATIDVSMKNEYIHKMESEVQDLKTQLKALNTERLALLQARGVSPKSLPKWVVQRNTSMMSENRLAAIAPANDMIRIWIGTWNLGGNDILSGVEADQAYRYLHPFVSSGYDIYAISIQDAANDVLFTYMEHILEKDGYYRLTLEMIDSASGMLSDVSKIQSSSNRMMSVAIFIHRKLRSDVKLVAASCISSTSTSTSSSSSSSTSSEATNKGVIAICLTICGRSILFLSCHLEASIKHEARRQQYQQISSSLGSKLGEQGYHLNEQFNHILCFGDFQSLLIDKGGNILPADTAIQMLEDNLQKSLYDYHDQLKHDRRNQVMFYAYREPTPYPNFYPTYKKYTNRKPHDYHNKAWVKECYKYRYKAPFYKGGGHKEKAPSYADRILYHSMVDLGEDLLPECIDETLMIHARQQSSAVTSSSFSSSSAVSSSFSDHNNMYGLSSEPKPPQPITSMIDNYQSVNDGDILSASDHSPVFGTFLLRVKKDYEPFKQELVEKLGECRGNIQDLLTALHLPSTSSPSSDVSKAISMESIDEDTITTPSSSSSSSRFDFTYSLLRPAQYKILLHSFKLIWGACENVPVYAKLLFPAPYEAIVGEKFVDFYTDMSHKSSSSSSSGMNGGDMMDPAGYRHTMNTTTRPTSKRLSMTSSFSSSPPTSSSFSEESNRWRNTGPSKTGSCMIMEYGSQHHHIPAIQLIWRGQEPLDRLHIAMQVRMPATSIQNPSSRRDDSVKIDYMTGSCSLSLEQLCKAALVSSGGETGSVSVTRQLLKDSMPLYCIDHKTMQVSMIC